ncbi:RNA polymerase II-binding domain-containing protein [Polychytrium aggregatum]|uniref:RNA polymerase II-binding domain-containing protein n=1 Tax=Polychytrium aggregatum TaxID=110093 RepID=UPI0022FE0352|nr:RNA polymerase II-binding domain-containing protein [Polychytrium aggregatum]KAI9207854.1 RNA polymerase II-binding domain-containing protein [Polychytrium aggregatum]
MSVYTKDDVVSKLRGLVDSQERIIYHRKRAAESVDTWFEELRKCTSSKKLTMLYLCNDIVQNSKRRGEEFVRLFGNVLPAAISHIYRHGTVAIQNKTLRVLGIWEERHIYPSSFIQEIKASLGIAQGSSTPSRRALPTAVKADSEETHPHTHLLTNNSQLKDVANALALAKQAEKRKDEVLANTPKELLDPGEGIIVQIDDPTKQTECQTLFSEINKRLSEEIDAKQRLVGCLHSLAKHFELQLGGLENMRSEYQGRADALLSAAAGPVLLEGYSESSPPFDQIQATMALSSLLQSVKETTTASVPSEMWSTPPAGGLLADPGMPQGFLSLSHPDEQSDISALVDTGALAALTHDDSAGLCESEWIFPNPGL